MLPATVASNVLVQGRAALGGCQRREPKGGAAYGIPRYDVTPPAVTPHTGPSLVAISLPALQAGPAADDAAELDEAHASTAPTAVALATAITRTTMTLFRLSRICTLPTSQSSGPPRVSSQLQDAFCRFAAHCQSTAEPSLCVRGDDDDLRYLLPRSRMRIGRSKHSPLWPLLNNGFVLSAMLIAGFVVIGLGAGSGVPNANQRSGGWQGLATAI